MHEDSPDEARRRALFREACRLLDAASFYKNNWLQKFLPKGRRWSRAMSLFSEADVDSLAPLENQLRSQALTPVGSIKGIESEESRREIVDGVIVLRSSLLRGAAQNVASAATPPPGKLLLYMPSENVSDGASRYASNGFFDPYDCPPWDIWLRYDQGTLVSWVPEVLIPLAQIGIDANPVACIEWAD